MNKQIYNWYLDMTDPNMDGFTGWAAKQKLYLMRKEIEEILSNPKVPTYAGEQEWLELQNIKSIGK